MKMLRESALFGSSSSRSSSPTPPLDLHKLSFGGNKNLASFTMDTTVTPPTLHTSHEV